LALLVISLIEVPVVYFQVSRRKSKCCSPFDWPKPRIFGLERVRIISGSLHRQRFRLETSFCSLDPQFRTSLKSFSLDSQQLQIYLHHLILLSGWQSKAFRQILLVIPK